MLATDRSNYFGNIGSLSIRVALKGLLAFRPFGPSKPRVRKSDPGGSPREALPPTSNHALLSWIIPERGRMRYSVGLFFFFLLVLQYAVSLPSWEDTRRIPNR